MLTFIKQLRTLSCTYQNYIFNYSFLSNDLFQKVGWEMGKGTGFSILCSFLIIMSVCYNQEGQKKKGKAKGGREGDSLSPSPCSEALSHSMESHGFPLALFTGEEVSPAEWKFQPLTEFGACLNDSARSYSFINQSWEIILTVHKHKI